MHQKGCSKSMKVICLFIVTIHVHFWPANESRLQSCIIDSCRCQTCRNVHETTCPTSNKFAVSQNPHVNIFTVMSWAKTCLYCSTCSHIINDHSYLELTILIEMSANNPIKSQWFHDLVSQKIQEFRATFGQVEH